jgi:cell division protease FtsH
MSNMPQGPNQNRPPNQGGPSRLNIPNWVILLIIALLVITVLGQTTAALRGDAGRGTVVDVPYSFFREQLTAGKVSVATFSGARLDGEFTTAVKYQAEGAPTPIDVNRFTTILPPYEDPELATLLRTKNELNNNVRVQERDQTPPGWLVLLVNALPFVLIVGLMIWLFNRARQQQGGIFGFGQSRARKYSEEMPQVTFEDVAGEEAGKSELAVMVDFLKDPDKYLKLGARIPRGVLLIGPPGTGKTLLARAVAGEAKVPFFSLSASEFVEMFVGVGASRVRDLFSRAKAAAPCIVFIDELDAVGRQRGAGLGGGNDEREQTLNQLLVEMDGFDQRETIIVMAATNRPDVLDPALLRPGRFDRQVTVGLPDRHGRTAILKVHTKHMPLAQEVDLTKLGQATIGFSGADIENLANEAALSAARNKRDKLVMRDFELALDRIILGSERPPLSDENERRTVAVHEAGHALAGTLTPEADRILKVTIVPRGRALGVTQSLPLDDRRNYSKEYLFARLVVLLGGRSAEEVSLGKITSGAENDLRVATKLARDMVAQLGMNEELGPLNYGDSDSQPFLGYSLAQPRQYSEATAALIDRETKRLVEQAHEQARRLMRDHRAQLDALAAELMENEIVDGSRVMELMKPVSQHNAASTDSARR